MGKRPMGLSFQIFPETEHFIMRYYQKDVVFQEVPGEISLSYFISGCPIKCKGCHSAETWDLHSGKVLTMVEFVHTLTRYKSFISCVLFMGGEWHESELVLFLKKALSLGFKTCLYTGENNISPRLRAHLTYLKTGPWIPLLGGLDAPTTNQRFIEVITGKCLNKQFLKQPLAV